MSRIHSPLKRLGHLGLALLGGAALLGPTVAAFAASRPAIAAAMKPPHAVIHVHAFENLGNRTCMPDPPVHRAYFERSGRGIDWGVEFAMEDAAFRCLRSGTNDHIVLRVSIDARGRLARVQTDAASDSRLAACAEHWIRRQAQTGETGPGQLTIGYFMGSNRP